MHPPHQFRRNCVLLTLVTEAIEPVVLQVRRHRHRRESDGKHRIVTIETILQKFVQALARERAAGILEESSANVGIQTNHLEQMAVAIAGNGRDAHARDHFAQTLFPLLRGRLSAPPGLRCAACSSAR